MDGSTANKTDQKKQTMMMTTTAVTATDTGPSSDRLNDMIALIKK